MPASTLPSILELVRDKIINISKKKLSQIIFWFWKDYISKMGFNYFITLEKFPLEFLRSSIQILDNWIESDLLVGRPFISI
jgi:hypothetical protein